MKTPILKKDLPGCLAGTKGEELIGKVPEWLFNDSQMPNPIPHQFTESEIDSNPDFFGWQEEPESIYKENDWVYIDNGNITLIAKIDQILKNRCYINWQYDNASFFYVKDIKRLATPEEIKQATEREDETTLGTKIIITRDEILFNEDVVITNFYIPVSDLKRFISIAENLQSK